MSEDREVYEIGDDWDVKELRREIKFARAELAAALKSRNRWKELAKRATDAVVELKQAGKES